jgi:hypothetical protein
MEREEFRKAWYSNVWTNDNYEYRYHWVDMGSTHDVPKKPRRWYNLTPSQATKVSDTVKAITIIAYTVFVIYLVTLN